MDRVRPWIRPLIVLAAAAFCFLAAQGTSIRLFSHLFYLLLALLAVSYAWAWLNLRGLAVQREVYTDRAQVGDMARERITITNRWPLPKLWVEVLDHSDMPQHSPGFVVHMDGGDRRRWLSRTLCTIRGKFTLGPSTMRSGDPFGIFTLQRRLSQTNEILVYPRTTPLPGFELPGAELPGGQHVRVRTYHVTPNVSTIREYAPGDSLNRIHWRSSARYGQLMVKEFELDPTADAYVVVDMHERSHQALLPEQTDRYSLRREQRVIESTEEYAVQAGASIARHLIDQSRPVGLVAWGQHREVIPPEREARQIFKILEALAVLRAYGSQSLAEVLTAESTRFGRNCTVVVITASLDERWVAGLQQLLYRGVRAVVVFVDPQSFGGWRDSAPIRGRLAELRTPTYMLRQGQALNEALKQPLRI